MKANITFITTAIIGTLLLSGFAGYDTVSNKKGIEFTENSSWKTVVATAQKENKPIFLDISASWCGPCKMLKWFTFSNKKVGAFYNENFINVAIDGEKGEGPQMAADLGLTGYPSLYFFDKNGYPVLYTMGYLKPDELITAGKAALDKLK